MLIRGGGGGGDGGFAGSIPRGAPASSSASSARPGATATNKIEDCPQTTWCIRQEPYSGDVTLASLRFNIREVRIWNHHIVLHTRLASLLCFIAATWHAHTLIGCKLAHDLILLGEHTSTHGHLNYVMQALRWQIQVRDPHKPYD